MIDREIKLGDVFYVFCNFGLCKGHVVKIEKYLIDKEKGYDYDIDDGSEIPTDEDGNEIKDFEINQYKLNIDINEDYKNLRYGFWFQEYQLYDSPVKAIISLCEELGVVPDVIKSL